MYRVGESCLVLDHLTLINVVHSLPFASIEVVEVSTVPIFE